MKTSEVFNLNYKYADLFTYAEQLAAELNVSFDENEIIYPSHIAKGYSKFFKINDYLSYQVVHYTTVQRMVFNRIPSSKNNITIAFINFSFVKSDNLISNFNEIALNDSSLGSIHCKSTLLSESLIIEPGIEIKVILVLLKENWAQNILSDSLLENKILHQLIQKKAELNLRKEFLSPEQLKLFTKVFQGNNSILMENLFYDSKVLNLLESFLKEVLNKEDSESPYLYASYEDIQMLQRAEHFINENLMKPFPGVELLSRISCMCRTKFINLFQKVYGLSSFEYSQKKRLAIAYDYLNSGKYFVIDTAQIIGYAGANNFAVAFKKEFGILPSELLERLKEIDHVK